MVLIYNIKLLSNESIFDFNALGTFILRLIGH